MSLPVTWPDLYSENIRKNTKLLLHLCIKGSRQKKPGYFTVRVTVRVGPPPPLRSAVFFFLKCTFDFCFFSVDDLKQILTNKMFLDPLYDPLVV